MFDLYIKTKEVAISLVNTICALATQFWALDPSVLAILFGSLLGGLIAILGIIKQRQTARNKNTIDFEAGVSDNKMYSRSFAIIAKVVKDHDTTPIADWADKANMHTTQTKALKSVLNRWERASNGVNKKVYDGNFLYDVYGTHVINLHTHLLPFILRARENQPKAFDHFLDMAEKWNCKRKKENYKKEVIRLKQSRKVAR